MFVCTQLGFENQGTGGVNSVFIRDHLPELGTDLISALAWRVRKFWEKQIGMGYYVQMIWIYIYNYIYMIPYTIYIDRVYI